jgi:FkbM family methyltransferase
MSILKQIPNCSNSQRALLEILRNSERPVFLFGTGVYAYVLARYLAASGVRVACAVVDRDFKSVDTFMGLNVRTTEEIGDEIIKAHVVVGVTNYPPVVRRLLDRGAKHTHVIDIPDYLNMPHAFMDKAFVELHEVEFNRAYDCFEDELSKQSYVALVKAKVCEDVKHLEPVVRLDNIYFPKTEFVVRSGEVFLDVGGYTGDTVKEFHVATDGKYKKVLSLEPSEVNFGELKKTVSSLDLTRVSALKVGAWDERATLCFAAKAMHIDNQITESGDQSIEVDTIDSLVEQAGIDITLAKLDINGAEYRALMGAVGTIRRCRPRVIVRLHTKEDMYQIPLLLKKISPDIKLYLRQRSYFSMMAILYAEFESTD